MLKDNVNSQNLPFKSHFVLGGVGSAECFCFFLFCSFCFLNHGILGTAESNLSWCKKLLLKMQDGGVLKIEHVCCHCRLQHVAHYIFNVHTWSKMFQPFTQLFVFRVSEWEYFSNMHLLNISKQDVATQLLFLFQLEVEGKDDG